MARVWMVRGGRNGEYEEPSFAGGRVVLGFREVPSLAQAGSTQAVREVLKSAFPDGPVARISNFLGQFDAFRNAMAVGDLILMPRKHTPEVAIGRVTGGYATSQPAGGHTRPVQWLRQDAPRVGLGQDVLTALSSRMTIAEIKGDRVAERIEIYAATGGDPGPGSPLDSIPTGGAASASTGEPLNDLGQLARDQILKHIAAKFHGHDLTRLVAAVLEADGFRVRASPPGPDDGIDIVAGRGALGFDGPHLVVQCKSGTQVADLPTLHALIGAVSNVGAQFGLLVSWGGFTKAVRQKTNDQYFTVRLWDSSDLLEAIERIYDHLPEQIRKELPLKRTWTLVIDTEPADEA